MIQRKQVEQMLIIGFFSEHVGNALNGFWVATHRVVQCSQLTQNRVTILHVIQSKLQALNGFFVLTHPYHDQAPCPF